MIHVKCLGQRTMAQHRDWKWPIQMGSFPRSKQNMSGREINTRNWKESNRLATVTTFKLCFILIARRMPSPSKDLESQSSATCHWIYLMMSFMFSAVRSQKRSTGSRATRLPPQPFEMEIELVGPSSGNCIST